MSKVIAFVVVAAFAAGVLVFTGCNTEELKKLQEQAASLTKENQDLKEKNANLDKDKKTLSDQVNALTGERDQCKKELDDLKLAAEEKKGATKKAAASAPPEPEKKEKKGGGGSKKLKLMKKGR